MYRLLLIKNHVLLQEKLPGYDWLAGVRLASRSCRVAMRHFPLPFVFYHHQWSWYQVCVEITTNIDGSATPAG
jgi:hypothetical protein